MFCVQFQKLLLKQMLQFQLVLEYKCCCDNVLFSSPELLCILFISVTQSESVHCDIQMQQTTLKHRTYEPARLTQFNTFN